MDHYTVAMGLIKDIDPGWTSEMHEPNIALAQVHATLAVAVAVQKLITDFPTIYHDHAS